MAVLSSRPLPVEQRTYGKAGRKPRTMLTTKQLEMLEALLTRQIGETIPDLAARCGVGKKSCYTLIRDPRFIAEYQRRLSIKFDTAKGQVADALIKAATVPGPSQIEAQKLFWRMCGVIPWTEKGAPQLSVIVPGGVGVTMTNDAGVEVVQATAEELSAQFGVETRKMMLRDMIEARSGYIDVSFNEANVASDERDVEDDDESDERLIYE